MTKRRRMCDLIVSKPRGMNTDSSTLPPTSASRRNISPRGHPLHKVQNSAEYKEVTTLYIIVWKNREIRIFAYGN